MTLPRLALAVIGDEIGPSLDRNVVLLRREHGLQRLDMRTVDGRNLLGMTTTRSIAIGRRWKRPASPCRPSSRRC